MDTIAIGDIHGRADLLEPLLEHVKRNYVSARIVFLGDVIDRGPRSNDCLELVLAELVQNPESVLIRGNHEDLMLRFVDGGSDWSRGWCHNGGLATVASYGYKGFDYPDHDGYLRLHDELAAIIKSDHRRHVEMLRSARPLLELDSYVLVHAGIIPGVPLDQQDPYQLAWNSKTLAAYKGPLAKAVVHGHTVTSTFLPEIHTNRINVDCGAYRSGVLCAVLLSEAEPRFIFSIDLGEDIEVIESDHALFFKRPLDGHVDNPASSKKTTFRRR